MEVLTVNVNGLRDQRKREAFLVWLSVFQPRPVFVCLQETHCVSREELGVWFANSGYSAIGSFGTSRSAGVVILCPPDTILQTSVSHEGGFFVYKWNISPLSSISPLYMLRQGCPLSAPLYVLTAETLAYVIRANLRLGGLAPPGPPDDAADDEALISQYADDTTLLCTTDDELREVFQVYENYEQASGAKLNLSKCKGFWAGSWRGRQSAPVSLQWYPDSLACLGVVLGHGDLDNQNWDKRITKCASVLESWSQRALSYTGKALVLNALALSTLWYVASLAFTPQWAIQQVSRHSLRFFWSNNYKNPPIAHSTLILPRGQGGIGLVDVKLKVQALLSNWARRFLCSPAKWSRFFEYYVHSRLGVSAAEVFAYPAYYPYQLLPEFYASVVEAWALLGGEHLFWSCSFVQDLLMWVQSLLRRAAPRAPALSPRHLLFGLNDQEFPLVPLVVCYLLHLVKYCVWLARNDFRFNGRLPQAPQVRASVLSRLNSHLSVLAKTCRTPGRVAHFHRAWNVLGQFSPDIYTLHP